MILRKSLAAAALCLCLAAAARPQPPQSSPSPQPSPTAQPASGGVVSAPSKGGYKALLERARKGDRTLDFGELRAAFYETDDYNPHAPMMSYRQLWGAVAQGNYAEAIKIADAVLEKNFVEVNAHMVAHVAHRETGSAERAQFHRFMADGLLDSIKKTGDGKSAETAFDVISINEEYALFRAMGLQPIRQSLIEDKGHQYDALVAVDPRTRAEATYYFRVDRPLNWKNRKKK
ncbi:MAG TPA: DUF4919 domain-containing protein [Pyrinomonadaceae bacterium]|jgi:hypothetical protein|nr:DUF4919 domain-containing protein [Pyrinomonadaceae bacterium]